MEEEPQHITQNSKDIEEAQNYLARIRRKIQDPHNPTVQEKKMLSTAVRIILSRGTEYENVVSNFEQYSISIGFDKAWMGEIIAQSKAKIKVESQIVEFLKNLGSSNWSDMDEKSLNTLFLPSLLEALEDEVNLPKILSAPQDSLILMKYLSNTQHVKAVTNLIRLTNLFTKTQQREVARKNLFIDAYLLKDNIEEKFKEYDNRGNKIAHGKAFTNFIWMLGELKKIVYDSIEEGELIKEAIIAALLETMIPPEILAELSSTQDSSGNKKFVFVSPVDGIVVVTDSLDNAKNAAKEAMQESIKLNPDEVNSAPGKYGIDYSDGSREEGRVHNAVVYIYEANSEGIKGVNRRHIFSMNSSKEGSVCTSQSQDLITELSQMFEEYFKDIDKRIDESSTFKNILQDKKSRMEKLASDLREQANPEKVLGDWKTKNKSKITESSSETKNKINTKELSMFGRKLHIKTAEEKLLDELEKKMSRPSHQSRT